MADAIRGEPECAPVKQHIVALREVHDRPAVYINLACWRLTRIVREQAVNKLRGLSWFRAREAWTTEPTKSALAEREARHLRPGRPAHRSDEKTVRELGTFAVTAVSDQIGPSIVDKGGRMRQYHSFGHRPSRRTAPAQLQRLLWQLLRQAKLPPPTRWPRGRSFGSGGILSPIAIPS